MKCLLTNDDGVDAPGLAALEEALSGWCETVVLAPNDPHSGCGHRATTHAALQLTTHARNRHSLDGTPVDCSRVGLLHMAPASDWLIAGINEGANLGADVFMSGTVAAAREAALLGRRAVAVSHYRRLPSEIDWRLAARWTAGVLKEIFSQPLAPGAFWNVNLPHLSDDPRDSVVESPEIVCCGLDPHPLPVDYRREGDCFFYSGSYHARRRERDRDVDVCFSGRIAVSQVSIY